MKHRIQLRLDDRDPLYVWLRDRQAARGGKLQELIVALLRGEMEAAQEKK